MNKISFTIIIIKKEKINRIIVKVIQNTYQLINKINENFRFQNRNREQI